MTDPYNRKINYLRISVTDRCNLNCIYCTPSGTYKRLRHEDILTYEEILRLVRIGVSLGIDKVRVTGGEPLVRKGIYSFLASLSEVEGIRDLSITTNGIFLKEGLGRLKDCGIKRINVSLDTLKRNKYKMITGLDGLQAVLESLFEAEKMGFDPIKINVVVMKGINDDEVLNLARLTLSRPFHVRFIEYMPMGADRIPFQIHYIPNSSIKRELAKVGELVEVGRDRMDGPVRRYRFKNAKGEIGFISPISDCFCATCNRIRLMASGEIKPCLLSEQHIDIKTPMRNGEPDEILEEIFLMSLRSKPYRHNLTSDHIASVNECMSSVGG